MNDLAATSRINSLQAHLDSLQQQAGVRQFDPTRFHFIESMAKRITEHRGASRTQLEQRGLAALNQYCEDFKAAKFNAEQLLQKTIAVAPDSEQLLRDYLQRGDLNGLKRLSKRLHRAHQSSSENRRSLIQLTEQLLSSGMDNEGESHSVINQLQQQEFIARQALATGQPSATAAGELKSVKAFRESWNTIRIDELVDESVHQGPKDAGPLNPQRLAIKSLSAMQQLSPQYMNRFVSYVETLLWLQQIENHNKNSARSNGSPRKKAPPKKAP